MNILVMGMGYVGITTALLFAELGNNVMGYDPDIRKMNALRKGVLPFHEPGVDQLLQKHIEEQKLVFCGDIQEAIQSNALIFLCVGTPSNADGSADLSYIKQAASSIGRYMREETTIVTKSTVPIGTSVEIDKCIARAQPKPIPFDVASNPEFLREGSALRDSLDPDRIVIGSNKSYTTKLLSDLYEHLNAPIIVTNPQTAEMIKYASNSFLATKISFINELARFCETVRINITDVARGMGMDTRIGPQFLQAGIGYGGSCFPKDVNALIYTAKEHDSSLTILEKVVEINNTQVQYYLDKIEKEIGSFENKVVTVLGLAFKPDTDDTREAPSLKMISHLLQQQAMVRAHDPIVKLSLEYPGYNFTQCPSLEEAVQNSDLIILCTEWKEYVQAEWEQLKPLMNDPYIFDGRNALDELRMKSYGFQYMSVSK